MKIFFVGILAFIFIIGPAMGQNIILDPGFEESEIKYWNVGISPAGAGEISLTKQTSYSGTQSLLVNLVAPAEIKATYRYTFSVNPGDIFVVGAAMKIEKRELGGFATRIEVQSYGTNQPIFALEAHPPANAWQGWQMYKEEFSVPADVYSIQVVIYHSTLTGSAWFDELWLERTRTFDPFLMVNADVVQQGQQIIIRGAGFPTLQKAELFLENKKETESKTDGQGRLEIKFSIPKDAELKVNYIRVIAGSWEATTTVKVVSPDKPAITGVEAKITNGILEVEMTGEPDGQASFFFKLKEKEGENEKVAMVQQKKELGLYRGDWKIPVGTQATAPVVVKLTKNNQTSAWETTSLAIDTSPGKIYSFSVAGSPVNSQGKLYLTLIGERGGSASFTIPNLVTNSSLQDEGGTGVYRAEYDPPDGKMLKETYALGKLVITGKTYSMPAPEPITIDTILPKIAVSFGEPDDIYRNGETITALVRTDSGSKITAEFSELDSTKPKVEFKEDGADKGFFRGSFSISKDNKNSDGKKKIVATVSNPAGNISSATLEVNLLNAEKFIEVRKQISLGYSIFSMPVNPGEWKLSDLASFIGPSLEQIIWHDGTKFIVYLPAIPVETGDKKIEWGEGYILKMLKAETVIFKGRPWGVQAAPPSNQLIAFYMEVLNKGLGKSALFQNYPNPFNAETWIPFKLNETSDTSITIYDIHGRVVRKLALGFIPAGIYQTKASSAYWDGTDDRCERVASGIYFYHLKAGKFSASRKMVIIK